MVDNLMCYVKLQILLIFLIEYMDENIDLSKNINKTTKNDNIKNELSIKIINKLLKLATSNVEIGGIIRNNKVYPILKGTETEVIIPVEIEKYGIIFHTHPIKNSFDNWLIHSDNDFYECFRRFFSNSYK